MCRTQQQQQQQQVSMKQNTEKLAREARRETATPRIARLLSVSLFRCDAVSDDDFTEATDGRLSEGTASTRKDEDPLWILV